MYVRGSDKNIEYKRDLNGFFRGIIMSDADPLRLYRCRIFVPEIHELVYDTVEGREKVRYYIAPDELGSLQPDDHKQLIETLPWAEQASSLFGEQGLSHYNAFRGTQTGGVNYPQKSSRNTPPNSRKMGTYPSQVASNADATGGPIADNNPFNPTTNIYAPAPNAPNAHGIHGIPSVGAHVWVFFDRGDINCPVYFAACPSAAETNQVFHDGQYADGYSDNYKESANVEDTPPEPKDPNSPTNYANGERVPGQQLPVREELKNLTPAEREEFYRLVDSEVGGEGQDARIAFMETVANRAKMNGETIPELIQKDRKRWADYKAGRRSIPGYFDTIRTGAANRPLNHNLGGSLNNARETYNRDFAQVIGGSNITRGATHNASKDVAQVWNLPSKPRREGDPKGYDGQTGTDYRYGGELFYSKTNERRFRQELLESARSSNIPPSIIVDGRTIDAPVPTGGGLEGRGMLPPRTD